MDSKAAFIFLITFFIKIISINCHGTVMDPVSRGSAWRKNFSVPENYNDNENFCGGFEVQYKYNNGKCGLCGDNYADKRPRAHEHGGTYGTGTIVKTYKSGSTIDVNVKLTASHDGHFEFSLCPLKNPNYYETEKCFNEYPLYMPNGSKEYPVLSKGYQQHYLQLVLPKNLVCDHCVFRWHYRTGNSWGVCNNGREAMGCGDQEVFRTCSDISIIP